MVLLLPTFILSAILTETVSSSYPYRDINRCGKVHITVSSLKDTYIELNWNTKCDHPEDIIPSEIALFDSNPLESYEDLPARVRIFAADHSTGYFRTKVKFGFPILGSWEYRDDLHRPDHGPHCFPYWIASFTQNSIIDAQCLKIQPTWMSDNSTVLGPKQIGNLFIPGTHNSGTSLTPSLVENFVMNQDRSVWTQLVFGIRYLDLRIGYYKEQGFFINHDVWKISALEPVLKEIRKFVELAPKEVIIIDVHRLPFPQNFRKDMHDKLASLIHSELGHLTFPSSGYRGGKGPTLNEIWARNKNLIIAYPNKEIVREHDWLWSPISQLWGNKRKVSDLREFLSFSIRDHKPSTMWALMSELTPNGLDVFFRINNLRQLADSTNRHVTRWFRDEWWRDVNVVATDFFLGNDIINVAIDANIHR